MPLSAKWHKRYGHVNFKYLLDLENHNMAIGLPKLQSLGKVCEAWCFGKQKRTNFVRSTSRAQGILDLIHTNVWGNAQTRSINGSLYYLTFIDDYSRYYWVYFLKEKFEVFSRFQEFKAMVENQTGRKIKVMRSNRGGEYMSSAFINFCKNHGI